MRWLIAPIVYLVVGCGPVFTPEFPSDVTFDEVGSAGAEYAERSSVRRAALEGSLVNPSNGYSQLRLAKYTDAEWGSLEEWNPPVQPMSDEPLVAYAKAIDIDSVPWEADALRALGEYAFFNYPGQISPALHAVRADPEKYGLIGDNGSVETLVWAKTEGGLQPANTCSTCHSKRDDNGPRIAGRPNGAFDFGAALDDYYKSESLASTWGPGRVDVTDDDVNNPTAITDLRPISFQNYLHKAGTLRNDLTALAVRIETLIITSNGERRRPPRKLAFALAWYFWSLGDDLAEPDWSLPGAYIFKANCAGCHAGEGLAGGLVPLEVIGTPAAVGESPARGTGNYRVPSLRGVGNSAPFFATGVVPNLETLVDPARTVPGHEFGLDLSEAERQDLLEFLRSL